MPTNKIILEIRKKLKENTDPKYKEGELNFLKKN